MTRRIGVLSVSLAALGLAVAGYFVQGAGAGSAPVEVADFGVPTASVAAAGGDEYEVLPGDSALFHATSAPSKPACLDGEGLGLVTVTDSVAILCKGDEIIGYLVTTDGGETRLVDAIPQNDECPSGKDEEHPDA